MGQRAQERRATDMGDRVMSASRARSLARQVVSRVRERDAYAHETLDALLKRSDLGPRDSAFATRLAYGTISARGTLDEIVAARLAPGSSLQPVVSDCLAVSTYEILFLSTPKRAAVNEGVELVRAVQERAAGLANAILRRIAESADEFPWGDAETDIVALARLHAHPLWLARTWVDEYGHDVAESMMAANNEPAPLFLASPGEPEVVMQALADEGVSSAPCALPGCLVAVDPSAAIRSSVVAERRAFVMDAGAQFAVHAVPLVGGARIAEIGAGRGSKTLLMASRAASAGHEVSLLAIDTHSHKLDTLRSDALRLGIGGITTLVADATHPASAAWPASGEMDAVLVDAPCSGLGTLRRHPDRRWRAQSSEIEALAALGERLLHSAASLVKPGGFVVYSTCTVARRENHDVVASFLASAAGEQFSTDPLNDTVPGEWSHFITPEGWFQAIPAVGGPDGHFVARLRRGN